MAEEKTGFIPTTANTNWNAHQTPSTGEEGRQETNEYVNDTQMGNTPSNPTTSGIPPNTTTPMGPVPPIKGQVIPNINSYIEPRDEYNIDWIIGMKPEILAASAVLRNEFRNLLDKLINDIALLYATTRVGKEDTVALVNMACGQELVFAAQTLDHLWGRREDIGGGSYKFDIPTRARAKAAQLEKDMAELLPGQVLPGRDGKAVLNAIDKVFDVLVDIINYADNIINNEKNNTRLAKKAQNDSEMIARKMEEELTGALDKAELAGNNRREKEKLSKQVKKLSKELDTVKGNLAIANSKVSYLGKKAVNAQKDEKSSKDLEYKYNELKEETDALLAMIIGRCPEDGINNLNDAKEVLKKKLSRNFKQTELSIKLNNQIVGLEMKLNDMTAEKTKFESLFKKRKDMWSLEKSKANAFIKRSLRALGNGLIPTMGVSEPTIRERFNRETDNFQYRWFLINKTKRELLERNIVLKNDLGRAMTAIYAQDTVDPEEFTPVLTDERAAAAQFGNPNGGYNGIGNNPSNNWNSGFGGFNNAFDNGFYASRGRGRGRTFTNNGINGTNDNGNTPVSKPSSGFKNNNGKED